MFKLIIIFMVTYGVSSTEVTHDYPNIESCDSAGRQAVNNYQEGSVENMPRVAWTCIQLKDMPSGEPGD